MEKNTASLILMAYPDTFVKPSNEGICSILPYIGIGSKDAIKAGHAALCLICNETGKIEYYDFGRYITPNGKGRVRSHRTDAELDVPIKAILDNTSIKNLKEILNWLYQHPEKTHGDGDLHASVALDIDLEKAQKYIHELHTKGSVPYGLFVKEGSNCARFVADTFLASNTNKQAQRAMKNRMRLTPSPMGIIYSGSSDGVLYRVNQEGVHSYSDFSQRKNWQRFLAKKSTSKGTKKIKRIAGSYLLEGIGSSAQFTIKNADQDKHYLIARYSEEGVQDCENIFTPTETGFDISKEFTFVYDSNCDHCHIQQEEKIYRFNKKQS